MFIVERFLVLIAFLVIYFSVKIMSRRKKASESALLIQQKQADAEARIEGWEKRGGAPQVGVWQALGRMHVMVVVAPELFKPFIAPAPPEIRARLEQTYEKLGVSELAQDKVPDRIWGDHAFAESYRQTLFEVRAWALRSGWRS